MIFLINSIMLTIEHAWYGLEDKSKGVDVTGILRSCIVRGVYGDEVHINEERDKFALNLLFLGNRHEEPTGSNPWCYMKVAVVQYHYDNRPSQKLVTPRVSCEAIPITIVPLQLMEQNQKLRAASWRGDVQVVKESLEARADPNILMDGRGPLHEACIWRAGEAVVRLLLERAANPLFSGTYKKRQRSPAEIANEKGDHEIAHLISHWVQPAGEIPTSEPSIGVIDEYSDRPLPSSTSSHYGDHEENIERTPASISSLEEDDLAGVWSQ